MALTLTTAGIDVSCEKYEITATTDNPSNVDAVQMQVYVEGFGSAAANVLEHVLNIGSTTAFTFEVNSVLRHFFERTLLPLSNTPTQNSVKNVLATLEFREVINNVVQATPYRSFVNLKSFALDAFESDIFVTQSGINTYDCGDAGSVNSKFLTSSPNTVLVYDFRSILLSVLKSSYSGTTPKQKYVVTLTNPVGAETAFDIPINVTSRTYLSGATGKYDISTLMYPLKSSAGFNAVKATVQVKDVSGGAPRSEIKTFINANYGVSRIRGVVVHWINEFGVQECYTFAGEFNRTVKSDRQYITRSRPVNPTSADIGQLAYATAFNYDYTLFTTRISQDTAIWLAKMMRSSRIAIESFDTYQNQEQRYYPISIITSDILDESEYTPTTLLSIRFTLSNERRGLL